MTISYNVQHSPMGAFASFTIGHFGSRGGMASAQGKPAGSNVFIGYRRRGGVATLLPFFEGAQDLRAAFQGQASAAADPSYQIATESDITRELSPALDEWRTGPLRVRVISPFFPINDPLHSSEAEQRLACCPAVFVTLHIDNRAGNDTLEALFALDDETFRQLIGRELTGFAVRTQRGFACSAGTTARAFQEFQLEEGLQHAGERLFGLGRTAGFLFAVPPGEEREFVVALAWYDAGVVTSGQPARYWYTRLFDGLESVLEYALSNYELYRDLALERRRELYDAKLNPDQRFLLSHAIHSYFGSTAWFDLAGRPLWVVAEGEYVMMNTLDLTVDQAFFELKFMPWALRSELEFYARHYVYADQVFRPGAPDELLPGGVAFCHDHGVANQFSPSGHSAYELYGLDGECFSYMSYEELTNWILCAGMYVSATCDQQFLVDHAELVGLCYQSLLNRDDPDPARRTGVMGCDGARTRGGREITTYDSLDASLGPARGNLYLTGKTWAAFVALADLFGRLGDEERAGAAFDAAKRSANAIVQRWDEGLGYIPAVFDGQNRSAIIPAIEALIYPRVMKLTGVLADDGPFSELLRVLTQHLVAVLRPGVCLFEDGGWKISSTSDNSWLSKIAILQHVARTVLRAPIATEVYELGDRTHVRWQQVGSGYWACSDQFKSGVVCGSRYYPRAVSTILWLES